MRALCLMLMASPVMADTLPDIPFQTLTLDPSHASVTASVNHLGLSEYTLSFDAFSATLDFGTNTPEAAQLRAEIPVASLDLPSPPDGFLDQMLGAGWFDAAAHPVMTFTSTAVAVTGPAQAEVTGDMTLLGQTAPVTLDVTFNGGYAKSAWEPFARIGFSATGTLLRSDFGMDQGIPAPGTTLGVGDEVRFMIEAEFVGLPENAPAD